jgi:hypothetical protein
MGIVDVTRLPKNDGGNNPGPENLPNHSGPPELLLDISRRRQILYMGLVCLSYHSHPRPISVFCSIGVP